VLLLLQSLYFMELALTDKTLGGLSHAVQLSRLVVVLHYKILIYLDKLFYIDYGWSLQRVIIF
jgi:hypothetical protein